MRRHGLYIRSSLGIIHVYLLVVEKHSWIWANQVDCCLDHLNACMYKQRLSQTGIATLTG